LGCNGKRSYSSVEVILEKIKMERLDLALPFLFMKYL